MAKPYQMTKESRYLGLPLGFGFLGAVYALSAFIYAQPYFFGEGSIYLLLVLRTFAFVFLCVTYYFSRESSKKTFWWNTTFLLLLIVVITSVLAVNIPGVNLPDYGLTSALFRIINLLCIFYLCAHTLRSHLESSDPSTIWSPVGYIFLGISQYALIIYAVDNSMFAFWTSLAIRWAGFAMFLFVSYRSFYSIKKRGLNEKNRS